MHEGPRFPPAQTADPDGLILAGGRLTPDWLLEAYRQGIFPWPILFDDATVLAWFSPDPRAIVELDGLYVSRRLRRRMRSGAFRVTCDQDFSGVIAACAAPRRDCHESWITAEMQDAYRLMHRLGHAHSVEVWQEDRLVGGVYGLAIGGLFAGESMFFRARDASKIALVYLVTHLRRAGFQLFDVQQATAHMLRMGATTISRRRYLQRLATCRDLPVTFDAEGISETRILVSQMLQAATEDAKPST